jgi:hypothetical protein
VATWNQPKSSAITFFLAVQVEMQGGGRGRSQKEQEGEGAKTSEEKLEAIGAKIVGRGRRRRRKDRISVSFWERAEGIAGSSSTLSSRFTSMRV